MLSRAFGDRFISEKALRECAQSRKVCDGVIVYADALILVECKTASPKLETRHGTQDYPTYRKEWSTRAVNAADQFESTIQLLREGAFVSLGLEPGQRRDLYPVMGVFELLIHPVAYRVIRQVDLAGHSLLERMRRSDVKPLQLFQIREMELIEVAASAGKNVAELLRAKTATDDAAAMSLINFVFESGETFQKNFGPWHARRYWELADEASEYMKALGLGGASGGDAHSNEPHAQTGS
jgi:hypothetical protein